METLQVPPEPEVSENKWSMFKQSFIPYFQAISDSRKEKNQKITYFLAVVSSMALDGYFLIVLLNSFRKCELWNHIISKLGRTVH